MTPQELKNSILQLAIQGKLVKQRPEEGTAQELYAQIQAEKQRLIKEGKIKKEKPLPEITEDEKPFEIPEGWMWVRLGHLCNIINGFTPSRSNPDFWNGNIPWFTIDDIRRQGRFISQTAQYITNKALSKGTQRLIPPETVLLCCTASVGEYAYTKIALTTNQQFNALVIQEENTHLIWSMYLYVFAQTLKPQIIEGAGKTTFNFLSVGKLKEFLVPVPPFDEQKRIVAKIEELLPLVDRYEKAWTKLEDFNRRFPEDLKKSILQQAIQGKLVEQRPEEGTAQELYEQIQAEKRRLIKDGKIKKEKPLPEITEEEKPFDVPEGWRWVRLGTLTEAITSGSRDWAKYYSKTGDIFLRMGNLSKNSFDLRLDKIQRVTIPESTEGKRTSLQAGDLLFSITGEVGMLGLIPPDFGVAYINQHTAMLRFMEKERNRYIPYLLLTDYAQKFYNGNQHGIKNSFRLDSIAWLPVPLPPLAEQKRIVEKVEELLAMCERMK